ncbi:cyclic nucleotide-binding protein [Megasphaera cerevisiae DSM 20462]|jgi:CRP-like cAMP-binding protein|uniref:Cyclic nucleotide-binding protein n=1 Tax=Megasphaera cerevisiae DSM 20462 TaxID=1122219 RepID=A0A0J6WUM1_9FIRM|nr:Crp/Fnr family transcriptional regulator [Megasphaera cerevisiae]KMO85883.1 cyclic nucleotide-binding protein [Megasphaera cerevisiae DSM 20462]SJZ57101.1 cAMP-binding domain of CRP or a regulatory subunit of cAMP-dependent protein kinases [Megasphaera cerevisiae DSM 20462]
MKKILPILLSSPLFKGISETDMLPLLESMGVRRQSYKKGAFVFLAGKTGTRIGIVLTGLVHIVQEDYWGNRNIIAPIRVGNMFGEAFACLPDAAATVDVVVMQEADILFMDAGKILHAGEVMTEPQKCVAMNLLAVLAQKNLFLTEKIRYLSQRTTRQKLMFYLSDEARRHHSPVFSIPFNRQELADFLSVDRSAMSAELGRMKREGLLEYTKDRFELKERQ